MAKKVKVVLSVDRITIKGEQFVGMKGKTVEVDASVVASLTAHNFIEKLAVQKDDEQPTEKVVNHE